MEEPLAKARTAPFTCFYCGKAKQAIESSGEHIVPSSIGGTKNATFTDEICADCNQYMGEHVDLQFSRDWFIGAERLLADVKHRKKEPLSPMGVLDWDRQERVSVFVSRMGVTFYLAENTPDGQKRLLVAMDDKNAEMVEFVRKVCKRQFSGIPIANDESAAGKPYEAALTRAIMALGPSHKVKIRIRLTAWDREMVKIALGLSCMVIGEEFVGSNDADRLRHFLFEDEVEVRANMQVRGTVGVATGMVEPRITASWHPGGNKHLFALVGVPEGLMFTGNLFGKYENTVVVSATQDYHHALPGGVLPGAAWVVDGQAKTTVGPRPVGEIIIQSSLPNPDDED